METVLEIGRQQKYAIINRSFWPDNQVIGEALLQFAERISSTSMVTVIAQSSKNIEEELEQFNRGEDVKFKCCKLRALSGSSFLTRAFDSLLFTFWVIYNLLIERPSRIYVSTDPPVLIPFVVRWYSKVFRARYIYHLQDIHPEAVNSVTPLNSFVYACLRWMDNQALRNASKLVTITNDMRSYIIKRSATNVPIYLLSNPSFPVSKKTKVVIDRDLVFCGNLGRFQRIPLLLSAIERYLTEQGTLTFTFVGDGAFVSEVAQLSERCSQVEYLGRMSAQEAAKVVQKHAWGILSIDDEVTKFAFPSKASSYIAAGCRILAVCGDGTNVAKWVVSNKLGIVSSPVIDDLVNHFREIEQKPMIIDSYSDIITQRYSSSRFVDKLMSICEVKGD